ncbi:MAG: peptidylprolyl isomerase [Gammaproteobacteria bacterium]|nr:peptidylprolyl isomerase [Gammaproteobacteria bacterium]
MMTRFIAITLACTLLTLTHTTHATITGLQGERVLDRIVAVVNDDIILLSELNAELSSQRKRANERGQKLPPENRFRQQILDYLVLQTLQKQVARKQGIRIDDAALNRSLQRIAQQNQQSLDEFRQALLASGYDYLKFREDIRTEMLIARIRRQEVVAKVTVSDQEVNDFLEREKPTEEKAASYRLFHILIAVPEASSPETIQRAREKADNLTREFEAGSDFSSLALAYSDGNNALEGGDLGWRSLEQIPSLFTDIVGNMKVGDITQPIRSPNGFHLLHLSDKKGAEKLLINQTKARHILLKVTAVRNEEQTRNKLLELRERILAGESFADIARAHSEDTASAVDGGDLPWFGPGEMVEVFEDVAESLSIHEVSGAFRSTFGWHILEVLGRRTHDATEEQQHLQIKRALQRQKVEEETDFWLQRLKGEAYIEYRLDENT